MENVITLFLWTIFIIARTVNCLFIIYRKIRITFAEIDKLPEDEPVVFIAGTGSRQYILSHYPLSTTILIQPKVDTEKTEYAKNYDYVIINDTLDNCAKDIIKIIKNETKKLEDLL